MVRYFVLSLLPTVGGKLKWNMVTLQKCEATVCVFMGFVKYETLSFEAMLSQVL